MIVATNFSDFLNQKVAQSNEGNFFLYQPIFIVKTLTMNEKIALSKKYDINEIEIESSECNKLIKELYEMEIISNISTEFHLETNTIANDKKYPTKLLEFLYWYNKNNFKRFNTLVEYGIKTDTEKFFYNQYISFNNIEKVLIDILMATDKLCINYKIS